MLDGVRPVPADFAARYRERGYWADQPLFEGFTGALARYADRTALVDDEGPVTYRELSERSAHLARILLDEGFGPLDRIIVQLPNTAMFAYLYFALQRIGAAPVLALPGHRKREITQFAEISGARALAVPAAARGFDFAVDRRDDAVALHKDNVFWELSGWAPKYFPASLRTDIRGRLREKMMFGSDHPSLPYERILREWDELGYDQSVLDLVFHANAERVLGL
jgi:acyl-CoA synthetase (AMP-forming)/AMP-acid ligase II